MKQPAYKQNSGSDECKIRTPDVITEIGNTRKGYDKRSGSRNNPNN